MKRERISDAIGNINQKYIDEAAIYSGGAKVVRTFPKLTAFAACIAVIFTATLGYFLFRTVFPPKNIINLGNYASNDGIDISDPRKYVGISSYVFVAEVTETHDYYTERLFHRFPDVIDYYDMEFTECRLNVITNIKGNLAVGNVFSYYKVGGVNKSRTGVIIYGRDDIMPKVGKYYVFFGVTHPDGTMTGGGTFPLEDGITESNLEDSAVYQKYIDAYEHQIIPYSYNSYNYLCSADIHYGDGSYNAKLYEEQLKKDEEIDRKYAKEHSMSYEEYKKKYPTKTEYYKAVKKGNPHIK